MRTRDKLLSLLILAFMGYSISGSPAFAQLPIPPPLPLETSNNTVMHIAANDHTPPSIQFLTTTLLQGKNVLKFTVHDASSIKWVYANVSQSGISRQYFAVHDLSSGGYKTLVDITGPDIRISIAASDAAGNVAVKSESFSITPVNAIWVYFSDLFSKVQITLADLFKR